MKINRSLTGSLLILCCIAGTANAGNLSDNAYTRKIQGSYESVNDALSDAIVNQGLVIDYAGEVGAMLARTGKDVNAVSPYANAKYLQFCSASATHAAVAANPENIALCPYVVFSYELKQMPGEIVIGYRRPIGAPGDASKTAVMAIEDLLKQIVDDVTP